MTRRREDEGLKRRWLKKLNHSEKLGINSTELCILIPVYSHKYLHEHIWYSCN
jgi:hypothetical protein